MFEILVIYTTKDGVNGADFINELTQRGVLEAIRGEGGCIKYEYYMPYANSNTILLHEIWGCAGCQKAHMAQPHMKTAMEIKEKYIASVEIKKLSEL